MFPADLLHCSVPLVQGAERGVQIYCAGKTGAGNSGLKLSQMEVLELNEAFAAQSLGVIHELSQKCDLKKEEILARCNPNGGAIALGHPVGASGNRIIVTLLHEMIKAGNKLGLASLCIGGGMGTAVILKRD